MIGILAFSGLAFLVVAFVSARRSRRRQGPTRMGGFAIAALVAVFGVGLLAAGGYGYWYSHRPQPEGVSQPLYEGVLYTRDVRSQPRELVIHVVEIDLSASGIAFLVTPGEAGDGAQLNAQRTSGYLQEYDLQVAINGDFFELWPRPLQQDARVNSGDPLRLNGYASSRGTVYSQGSRRSATLFISEDNQAQFEATDAPVYNAISGDVIFLRDGSVQPGAFARSYRRVVNPRAAVGLDATGQTMVLVIVDGRQPNYSEGVSLAELADIMIGYGVDTALNLDGGGSVSLVVEGDNGRPRLLNSPLSGIFPGSERPVGNHLGLYATLPATLSEVGGGAKQYWSFAFFEKNEEL